MTEITEAFTYTKEHSKEARKNRGEVFTPEGLVEEMLHKLPVDFFTNSEKTILDPACGNGNFLFKALEWRINNGCNHIDAISTLYGIELDPKNADECRRRLAMGSVDAAVWDILRYNIVCADALNASHSGWNKVGYLWEANPFFE